MSISVAPLINSRLGSLSFNLIPTDSSNLMLDCSSNLLDNLPGETCSRFLSHSKYETITPPVFINKSGIIYTPFSRRIYSALKVIGAFAASMITLHLSFSAFCECMVLSKAAGISISQDFSINDSGFTIVLCFARGKSFRVPAIEKKFLTSSAQRP